MKATHIIRNVGTDKSELIRVEDGMVIACRQQNGVVYGENAQAPMGSRVFADAMYAKAFLRKLADIDLNTPRPPSDPQSRVAHIDEEEVGRKVITQ